MANEKRLIDANAIDYENIMCSQSQLHWLNAIIEEQPTVDAVEVVRGRWEKAEYHGFLRCDQCKDVYINEEWLADGKWNYCPNCGADMRERKDNDN